MSAPPQLNDFITAIKQQFAQIRIDTSVATCQRQQQATFITSTQVWALIALDRIEQLSAIVTHANHYQISIHPISCGKNWGYGSTTPPSSAVLIDMSAIKQISDYDSTAGTVSVTPGVNYQQLQQFLHQQQHNWRFNGPGSTEQASVLANTLQRGLNQGEQMEHWRSIIAIEAILADGTIVNTSANTTPAYGISVGPDIRGILTQSALAIVTKLTLALDKLPRHWQHLHLCWDDEKLAVAPLLQQLQLDKLISTSVSIHNLEKILIFIDQYPFTQAQGQFPLPPQFRQQWQQQLGGQWFSESAISAPTEIALTSIKQSIDRQLSELPGLTIHWGEVNQDGPCYHHLTKPDARQLYWRKPYKPPQQAQPEQHGCGVIWLVPVIPWTSQDIDRVNQTLNQLCSDSEFEPMVSFQFPNHRYGYAVISLLYDREHGDHDQSALKLYQQLSEKFSALGYSFYRNSLLTQTTGASNNLQRLQQQLKTLLDPQKIIASQGAD